MVNEKRLIDANAIPYEEHYVPNGDTQWQYKKELCVLKPTIDAMPTVDAVEVVRCKDCKHRGTDYCIFHIKGEPADEELLQKLDNDFCSYGERRNDG